MICLSSSCIYQPVVSGGVWIKNKFFSNDLAYVPCEMHSDGDSDSGSDRGQQRIVATDSKSDSSSDENVGRTIVGTGKNLKKITKI
ncbi:hypothetical protein B7P43_G15961 [Cryptotermes secundus]|uniref:Uncharacterized protein n=1 Tax=Cryptotermes secundus TaxID=105785 RepID=A0A2J7RGM7_9NEOP|nr:hypothetical protein B7P43_G15961 [Cryptotermes secundus]